MGLLEQFTQISGGFLDNKQNSPLLRMVTQLLSSQTGGGGGGGLMGLVQGFQKKGLGEVVNSWVSTGENKPISSEQIEQGLGTTTIEKWSAECRISPQETRNRLAQILPNLVDKMTPQGQVPEGRELDAVLSFLKNKLGS